MSKPRRRDQGIEITNMRLLYVAKDAADPENPRHSPIVALLFSAFWLEAHVNNVLETLTWFADQETRLPRRLTTLAVVGVELEAQRAQLPEKLHIISAILRDKPFDRAARPFQDLDLLLALRHRMVHSRPHRLLYEHEAGALSILGEPRKIRQGLIEREILSRADRTDLPWDVAVYRPKLGTWAFETANLVARAIGDCFPRGPWRQWAHGLNPLSPEARRASRRFKPVPRPPTNPPAA